MFLYRLSHKEQEKSKDAFMTSLELKSEHKIPAQNSPHTVNINSFASSPANNSANLALSYGTNCTSSRESMWKEIRRARHPLLFFKLVYHRRQRVAERG